MIFNLQQKKNIHNSELLQELWCQPIILFNFYYFIKQRIKTLSTTLVLKLKDFKKYIKNMIWLAQTITIRNKIKWSLIAYKIEKSIN